MMKLKHHHLWEVLSELSPQAGLSVPLHAPASSTEHSTNMSEKIYLCFGLLGLWFFKTKGLTLRTSYPHSSHRVWLNEQKLCVMLSRPEGREAYGQPAAAVLHWGELPRECVWQQLEPGSGLLSKRKWRRKVFISEMLWELFWFCVCLPPAEFVEKPVESIMTDVSFLLHYTQQIGGMLDTCLNQIMLQEQDANYSLRGFWTR